MILFAGIPSEPPLALAIAAAERMGVPHAVFNQRRSKYCDLTIESHAELAGKIWLDERCWELTDFTGIYSRTVEACTLPENRPRRAVASDPYDIAKSAFLAEAFNDWLEVAPSRIANRPNATSSNCSKPYQAQLILQHGFQIPRTLITNDPDEVRAFHAEYGRIVYKSTSAVRSIVCEWRPEQAIKLERVRALPTQFQALIPGVNVRVHVVAGDAFASEIESDAVDYRYAGREGGETSMKATELPADVADKCITMTRALGLTFSGITSSALPMASGSVSR